MRTRIPGSTGARILILAGNLLLSCLFTASAQLAITEVMSSASTNSGTTYLPPLSDYWELTNFGDSPIDLTGCKWNDDPGNKDGADPLPFVGLTIGARESIIFMQMDLITNADQFREWWGTNLPANLKVIPYGGNGLANPGDSVNLWGPGAANDADVIDREFQDMGGPVVRRVVDVCPRQRYQCPDDEQQIVVDDERPEAPRIIPRHHGSPRTITSAALSHRHAPRTSGP